IGIITKTDSPYANVPMVRNWMINSGCERVFEISNVTKEGIGELFAYLEADPVKIPWQEAVNRQWSGQPEWMNKEEFEEFKASGWGTDKQLEEFIAKK
ncbi:MAG: hypothetical protein IKD39_04715, partial [Oscillospiraceae bacterium]|nr:hypothetical protein [Oscillospiraceae bacterium]